MENKKVSEFDITALKAIRENIDSFLSRVASYYASDRNGDKSLLDVAPQVHPGAKPFFTDDIKIETLDIDPKSGATYIADLCNCAQMIGFNKFDYIVCTEVLEHTRQPFNACVQIYNMLKPSGYCFASVPFNLRIHGPLPDCWRFTEHGIRELFNLFEIVEINALEDNERFLMPLHYTVVVKKPARCVD